MESDELKALREYETEYLIKCDDADEKAMRIAELEAEVEDLTNALRNNMGTLQQDKRIADLEAENAELREEIESMENIEENMDEAIAAIPRNLVASYRLVKVEK